MTCAAGATTVAVEEGVVAVRGAESEVLVHAGQRISLGCVADADAPRPQTPSPLPTPAQPRLAPGSSLARMNAQYAQAMTLKRKGHLAAAAKALHLSPTLTRALTTTVVVSITGPW